MGGKRAAKDKPLRPPAPAGRRRSECRRDVPTLPIAGGASLTYWHQPLGHTAALDLGCNRRMTRLYCALHQTKLRPPRPSLVAGPHAASRSQLCQQRQRGGGGGAARGGGGQGRQRSAWKGWVDRGGGGGGKSEWVEIFGNGRQGKERGWDGWVEGWVKGQG